MTNRPGVMIRGKVVMAPGRIDSDSFIHGRFMQQTRVYVDGRYRHNVIGYDERGGEAVVMDIGPNLSKQLRYITGKVEARPHR